MTFIDIKDIRELEPVPGYHGRFLHCENMTVAFWEIEAGAVMPEHAHPHEQVFTILEGEFDLTIADETKRCIPGHAAVIPSNVPHSGRAITPCRVIDIFYPVREDLR